MKPYKLPTLSPYTDLLREIQKIHVTGSPRPFYTAKETQAMLGISPSTFLRMVNEGLLETRYISEKKHVCTHRSIIKLVMGDDYNEHDAGIVQLSQLVSTLTELTVRLEGGLRRVARMQEGCIRVLKNAGVEVDDVLRG